jgi:hypothetical protein
MTDRDTSLRNLMWRYRAYNILRRISWVVCLILLLATIFLLHFGWVTIKFN